MDYYRRNELPETVRRYKTYTDQFQAWLLRTAIQRGAEWATVVAEHTKKAKGKKAYKIPTNKQEELVKAITATNDPLKDPSGLLDLDDAIRSRKEVSQFYKYNNMIDQGHAYINDLMDGFATSLKDLGPAARKVTIPKPKSPTFYLVHFPHEKSSQDDNEALLEELQQQGEPSVRHENQKHDKPSSKKKPEENPLTEEEKELQREFLILCFLYRLNRIRGIVRDVWLLYQKGLVNAITAALVTDLAQGHIHQDVTALVEELGTSPGQLSMVVRKLFEKMQDPSQQRPPTAQPSDKTLRHLFCLEATYLMAAYLAEIDSATDRSGEDCEAEHPLMLFLRFFNVIRQSQLKLPRWDKFTEEILLRPSSSKDWLPFGFQIILDIQEVIQDDCHRVFKDLTEHGLDIARLIRLHVDYEDHMWAIGKKPDYICVEEIKFSTVFLQPLETLLDWMQELLKTHKTPIAKSGTTTDAFVTVHSTLAGLIMW